MMISRGKISFLFVLFILTLNSSYACISDEYNRAYSLYKHNDYDKSFNAFLNLYKLGCPTSPYFVGIHYAYGIGTKENHEAAIKYFNIFLDKNNPKRPRDYRGNAYLALAYIYNLDGKTTRANECLFESASVGNTEAMFLLGRSYTNNNQPYYVKTDLEKALFWLNKAANAGNVTAMQLIYQIRKSYSYRF